MGTDRVKTADCWDSLCSNNILDLKKIKKNLEVHESWKEFLDDNIGVLQEVVEQIRKESCSPTEPKKILRFLKQDLAEIKVVILGQDPYPYPNFATGRAFEVGTIATWKELANSSLKGKGKSLRKIITCIYRNVATGDNKIDNYDEILKKIENKTFNILPPEQWFDSMEEQGVLFLNTSFTCELDGQANSHRKIWNNRNDGFTKKLLEFINKKNPSINWFLWGKEANKCINQTNLYIPESLIFRSSHPVARLAKNKPDYFLNFSGFSQVTEIDWFGREI